MTMKLQESPATENQQRWIISTSLFGFGVFLAWHWMLFDTARLFPLGDGSEGLFLSLVRMGATLTQVLTLVVFFALILRNPKIAFNDKSLVVLSSIIGLVATVAIILSPLMPESPRLIICACGWTLCGVASGIINYIWIKLFSVVKNNELCLYVSGSIALGGILVYILCYLPLIPTRIIACLLPAACAGLSLFAKTHFDYEQNLHCERENSIANHRFFSASVVRLLVSILVFTIVYAALIAPLGTRRGEGFEANGGVMLAAPMIMGALIFTVTWFTSRLSSLKIVYLSVLPIMVIALVAFPFLQSSSVELAGFIASFGYEGFNIVAWVVLLQLAHRDGLPPCFELLMGRIAYNIGIFIGATGGVYFAALDLFRDKSFFTPLCLGAVVVLVIVTTVLLRESDMFDHDTNRLAPQAASTVPTIDTVVLPSSEEIFQEKTNRIAKRYGLTPRETEVFFLLAKGRSNKLIEDRLFISEHTVDSHVSHIYRKCDVHSRQAIMDLIENEHIEVSELISAKQAADANDQAYSETE